MKILFIHCRYGFAGGEDSVVREEIALLQSNGIDVSLLEFDNGLNKVANILSLPFNAVAYRRVKRACREYQPDLAHVHNTHFAASPAVLYALKKCGVPIVSTLHNYRLLCPSAILYHNDKIFTDSVSDGFPWKAIRKRVYRNSLILTAWVALSGFIHRRLRTQDISVRYIVLTDFARQLFNQSSLNIPMEQMRVKSNFVRDIPGGSYEPGSRFLFIGRLTEEKGIRIVLEAFANSSHTVTIAGDGPLRDVVKNYSDAHPNIHFTGLVDKHTVSILLSSSTALIFPSTWYEGMPMTIIEAFAHACPVIASDLGAMRSMIEPGLNGLLFRAGDSSELLKQLDGWQSLSGQDRQAFRSHARATYEREYTAEGNFRQLMTIYEEALPANKVILTKQHNEPSPYLKTNPSNHVIQ